jgi:hypothetical protein
MPAAPILTTTTLFSGDNLSVPRLSTKNSTAQAVGRLQAMSSYRALVTSDGSDGPVHEQGREASG